MYDGRFPDRRWLENAKRQTQQKGIERAPVRVYEVISACLRDFHVRDAIRVYFVAMRPNL
jgi:hypothetical protein